MTANIAPQFIENANVGQVAVTAGNTSSEGGGTIGTNMFLLFTAGANDSFVENVVWLPTASAVATATQATVARLFLSTVGAGSPTSANCFLLAEVALPSVSADSSTVANNPVVMPVNERIPTGYFLLVTNHAAPNANSQWVAQAFGGNY
jgi:hypothetical protein